MLQRTFNPSSDFFHKHLVRTSQKTILVSIRRPFKAVREIIGVDSKSHIKHSNALCVKVRNFILFPQTVLIQGPAEIPDDLQTQLRVEPLARGICP
jgi:hypothetical protein